MTAHAFDAAVVSYLLAGLVSLLGLVWGRSRRLLLGGDALYVLGLVANGVFLADRWALAGRAPLSDTFEVLVCSAFSVGLLYVLLRATVKVDYLGAFPALISLVCVAYASLMEPAIKPLVPALQNSFWLTIHVILCLFGYGAFLGAFVAGLALLMGAENPHRAGAVFVAALFAVGIALAFGLPRLIEGGTLELELGLRTILLVAAAGAILAAILGFPIASGLSRLGVFDFLAQRAELDALVHRSVAFGFPLLGLGIVAGAVWADQAWGSYWSWDPKETSSLVTWLVYSLYLHLRFIEGWRGPRATWVVVFGFGGVLFTWLGVNFLLSGLHAYD